MLRLLTFFAVPSALLQMSNAASVPGTEGSVLVQLQNLTLTGALLMAILVLGKAIAILWRANAAKDLQLREQANQMIEFARMQAQSSVMFSESNKSLIQSTERFHETIEDLRVSMGRLPCTGGKSGA